MENGTFLGLPPFSTVINIFIRRLNVLLGDHLREGTVAPEPKPTTLSCLSPLEGKASECEQISSPRSKSPLSNEQIASAFNRHWGEEVTVELVRDEGKGFGISIIGGFKDGTHKISPFTGILIKKILPDSPALRCGLLKTGDRLLEVGGVDLRQSSHDEAVETIKNAISPVKFVVQSLIPIVSPPLGTPNSRQSELLAFAFGNLAESRSVSVCQRRR